MKRLFTLCLSAICFLSITSCSKYYISTLSSTNALKDQKTGEFNVENDSVKVTYSFAGLNAPVKVTVRNKLAVPVYVDWSKSALIFQEKATSYVPDKIAFSADLASSSWRDPGITNTVGEVKGQIGTLTTTSFIPPNAKVEKTTIFIKSGAFQILPEETYQKLEVVAGNEGKIRVYTADFTRENSPIIFRSYLTLYTNLEPGSKAFALDSEFFVSRSVRSYRQPSAMVDYTGNFSDVFYTNQLSAFGQVTNGVAVLGVVQGNPPANTTPPENK